LHDIELRFNDGLLARNVHKKKVIQPTGRGG
jgi:hypothetical protein